MLSYIHVPIAECWYEVDKQLRLRQGWVFLVSKMESERGRAVVSIGSGVIDYSKSHEKKRQ